MEEKEKEKSKEIERRQLGKDLQRLQEQRQDQERREAAESRKREREEERLARERVREQIARDRSFFDTKMKFIRELLVRHSGVQPSGHTGFYYIFERFSKESLYYKIP